MTNSNTKIKTIEELAGIVARLKRDGKTVVHSHGDFDLLHPGHIRHFQAARALGDVLIVTLTQDQDIHRGPDRPVFGQQLRAESLAALASVDYVAINPWPTAAQAIRRLKPHIYVNGAESADELTGEEREAVEAVGGRIEFTHDVTFSSTHLINQYLDVFPEQTRSFLEAFRARHSADELTARLQSLANLRVLVIGDAIIDEYHYAHAMGKSSKSATIVARFLGGETYAGGALAVCNHVAGFCQEVDLVTCLGTEGSYEDFIRSALKPNVSPCFFLWPGAPTVVKRRFVDPFMLNKMFEICFLSDQELPGEVRQEVADYLEQTLDAYDLVIVADFGHGLLGVDLARFISEHAPFLALSVQANSANLGFNVVTKFPHADYICIDEQEVRLALHDRITPVEGLLHTVAGQMQCRLVAVTLGSRGSLTYSSNADTVSIPALSRKVVDTVGAGDAYMAVSSLCAVADAPAEIVGFVGNVAGALAACIVGNKESIDLESVRDFIVTLLK